MIVASVDTASPEYAFGQVVGVLAVALIAIVVVWRQTRDWRSPYTPPGGDPADTLREARKRHLIIVGASVLIAVSACVKAALSVSHDTAPLASGTQAPASAWSGAEENEPHTGAPPNGFQDFQRLTGEAAERAETEMLGGRQLPEGLRTASYDRDGDGSVDLFVAIRSAQWDPSIRRDKANEPIPQELGSAFAGARAHDVAGFDAGQHGGGLSCGLAAGPEGDRAVCAWSDATTFAMVRLVRETDLAAAARTTLALRNAATR
ncbi:hypothetical protein AB0953_22415 [Streptomyces sp. NPDC046866]|uniref:hypothetical protein n=1 Tax=Streptomyces sp. NPDC046866 TaxID=3154921 RepID=UPI0034542540